MTLEQSRKKIEKAFQQSRESFSEINNKSFNPRMPLNQINFLKNPKILYESDWLSMEYSGGVGG